MLKYKNLERRSLGAKLFQSVLRRFWVKNLGDLLTLADSKVP